MKTMIELIVYGVVSGLFGLVICGLCIRWNRRRAALIAGAILFGGPIAAYLYVALHEDLAASNFEADVAYVKELCAKHGGEKIYKTVDNVEGVFQMKARNPDPEGQWRDQYGMVDPWGMAQGDRHSPAFLSTRGRGYWFFEQQPGYGKPEGPPYRRNYLSPTGQLRRDTHPGADFKDDPALTTKTIEVTKLRSRYGYYIEDLSTKEMRSRWIAGGRIKVIDLQTKEVLAEQVGYFRAMGSASKMKWAGIHGTAHFCPHGRSLDQFLMDVLKPVDTSPTNEQLSSLKGE